MAESSDFKQEDIFHLEDSFFDVIERPIEAIIPEQNMNKKVFLFPKKSVNKKKNIVTGKKFKKGAFENFEKLEFEEIEIEEDEKLLYAEDYPGEIVETEKGFFISLQDKKGNFSWFLMK